MCCTTTREMRLRGTANRLDHILQTRTVIYKRSVGVELNTLFGQKFATLLHHAASDANRKLAANVTSLHHVYR